jgi:hypothetical protein
MLAAVKLHSSRIAQSSDSFSLFNHDCSHFPKFSGAMLQIARQEYKPGSLNNIPQDPVSSQNFEHITNFFFT